ncbi:hypothetical protein BYT27DRAFT_7202411 [Phlegmacium glaucopus]|nr:hypothetical protein BYT27DRAFT_7202411 [Phlegmacium glaucopus]
MGDLTIANLPTEIQLTILTLLDVQSLLAIRQTCRNICQLTHQKIIWLSLFEKQRQYLPLPHDLLHQEDPHLTNHPSSLIESIVRQAQLAANVWPRLRTTVPRKLEREGPGSTLIGMEMFLDRWLVVVYAEGVAYLYDTQPTPTINLQGEKNHQVAVLRGCLALETGIWASYACSLDLMANKLVFVIAPSYWVLIYEIQLSESSSNKDMVPDAFHLVRTITLSSYQTVRAVNTRERIVALSESTTVELVKWDEDFIPDQNGRKLVIALHSEGLEDLWNGIIAIHFMGSYMLIFKTRSIELHDFMSLLNSSKPSTWPSLRHLFPMTFRDVSFSNCSHSRNHISETDTYTTTLFAYDVIQGLFQYVVQLTLSSELSTFPPSLQVTLIGIYPLVMAYTGRIAAPSSMESTTTTLTNPTITYPANFGSSLDHSHVIGLSSLPRSRNTSDGNTRGFVSAHAMGPQGRRAIWIERKRSSVKREVQVWSQEPSSTGDLDSASDGVSIPSEIERRVVYSVNSCDLREDVTYCTFSELTGKIVLGNRSGDVSILDLAA